MTKQLSLTELVALISGIIAVLSGLVGLGVIFFTKILPWWRTKQDRVSLEKGLSSDLYSPTIISNSLRYYIEPYCQSLDPAGGEEPRFVAATKQKLFEFFDDSFQNHTQYRYFILLADSGMGKTSFVINYYARHLRRRYRKFELVLFPLGVPDLDKRIKKIPNKHKTVLFLDALDEDPKAINNHAERLKNLVEITRDFNRVLITCRTQFFPSDEEIPKESGIIKIVPIPAGEKSQYIFHKLYLSPFTDDQIDAYLRKRYPFWRERKKRKLSMNIIRRIPNLIVRPMLLAHIDDLLKHPNRQINYDFELYEEMVEAWLIREEGKIGGFKREQIRSFSEKLAVDIYINHKRRGAEHITSKELVILGEKWKLLVDNWQFTTRSLLNRDAVGNHKFAHRSILEYLFIKSFINGDENCHGVEWTDPMKFFLIEMIQKHVYSQATIPFSLKGADLSRIDIQNTILQGVELRNANLQEVNLQGANFQKSNLQGTNLSGSNLSGIDLHGANLKEVNLELANLENANLHDVNLENAKLMGCNLKDANLQRANLRKTNFQGASLEGANLEKVYAQEADFQRADLQSANLERGIFEKADFQEADFLGANLQMVNFQYANLRGVILYGTDLTKANLQGVDLWRADLEKSYLQGADFKKATLREANLRSADLLDCDLTEADMSSADIERADLKGSNLKQVNLQGANLKGANLQGVNFQMAELQDIKNLTIEQLSEVKTLLRTSLDPVLMKEVKKKHPLLLSDKYLTS